MAVTVKLDLGRLQALRGSLPQRTEQAVEAAARRIEGAAKGNAPVDTGTLRNSITVENSGTARRKIGPTVDYGVFVELGTKNDRPQPYLKPAFDAVAPRLIDELKRIVD